MADRLKLTVTMTTAFLVMGARARAVDVPEPCGCHPSKAATAVVTRPDSADLQSADLHAADDHCQHDCDKAGHVHHAVQHLEAAGLFDEARRLRRYLEKSDAPETGNGARHIRAATAASQPPASGQVVIHAQLIEVSLAMMRRLGVTWETPDGQTAVVTHPQAMPQVFSPTTYDSATLSGIIEALRREKMVKVLAEPTLVTVDGRPASLVIGRRLPPPKRTCSSEPNQAEIERTGMRLDVVPRLVDQSKIRLDLRLEWSGLDQNDQDGDVAVPRIRRHTVDTAFETKPGRTIVLAGSTPHRGGSEPSEGTALYLLVRSELVAPVEASTAHLPVSPSPTRR